MYSLKMNTLKNTITNSNNSISRETFLFVPENVVPEKFCVFLDAEFYLNSMDTLNILSSLTKKKLIPNMAFLFVSSKDAESRQIDYICNPMYSSFITNEVPQFLKSKFPNLHDSNNYICGLSLSALQSAFVMLNNTNIYSQCLAQSGSFWWNDEWLRKNLPNLSNGCIWASVGSKETTGSVTHPPTNLYQGISQIDGVQNFVREIKTTKVEIEFQIYEGGHELPPWEKELAKALTWLSSRCTTNHCTRSGPLRVPDW